MRRQRGFTLMEMLVVVAIVAILTTVAIPTFSASLDSAREATCAANRRSLKGLLSAAYMTGGQDGYNAELSGHLSEYSCPAGGTIGVSLDQTTGAVWTYCSRHYPGNLGNQQIIAAVKEELSKVPTTRVDSGAIGSEDPNLAKSATAVYNALKTAGIDLREMDAETWCYRKNPEFFFWTPVDISTLEPGTNLPVLRYNFNTGTYTVWIDKVAKSGQGDYLVLQGNSVGNGYAPSTSEAAKDQTYEKAMEHFATAMEDYSALSGGS